MGDLWTEWSSDWGDRRSSETIEGRIKTMDAQVKRWKPESKRWTPK
ncbi:hypothetical protein [Alkalicoccobacillus plakortidis]|uniref:Uncharacterized protein n=1 Tax=Alkalicoccobacillus plakortidis TaxID=444060 RepID=A0ABT0XN21_9BACI|nr:hypothetical protein [Alkalicoccobacillus plakortidis]MCM2677291.1 hypothetical protein [Alkalicoccobacillus plakortidis]